MIIFTVEFMSWSNLNHKWKPVRTTHQCAHMIPHSEFETSNFSLARECITCKPTKRDQPVFMSNFNKFMIFYSIVLDVRVRICGQWSSTVLDVMQWSTVDNGSWRCDIVNWLRLGFNTLVCWFSVLDINCSRASANMLVLSYICECVDEQCGGISILQRNGHPILAGWTREFNCENTAISTNPRNEYTSFTHF